MKRTKVFFKLVLLTLFFIPIIASITASFSLAKPEFAKQESKTCTVCHVKLGSDELNDTGKYYKEHGSLEGYEQKK